MTAVLVLLLVWSVVLTLFVAFLLWAVNELMDDAMADADDFANHLRFHLGEEPKGAAPRMRDK